MSSFFTKDFTSLVESPNGSSIWWHSLPLPDGRRINGANTDKSFQHKMWDALQIGDAGLQGKAVLDIGANDGFFSVAACLSGAADVTSLNSADWATWPENIQYATKIWGVAPNIVTDDFRTHHFNQKFDVIFFLGVIYHTENVFDCMKALRQLLNPGGTLYIETHVTNIKSDVPIFEYASDSYRTSAPQGKETLGLVGISNYLFPNAHAMHNLAISYGFGFEHLSGPTNVYSRENPLRQIFRFTMAGQD